MRSLSVSKGEVVADRLLLCCFVQLPVREDVKLMRVSLACACHFLDSRFVKPSHQCKGLMKRHKYSKDDNADIII